MIVSAGTRLTSRLKGGGAAHVDEHNLPPPPCVTRPPRRLLTYIKAAFAPNMLSWVAGLADEIARPMSAGKSMIRVMGRRDLVSLADDEVFQNSSATAIVTG